MKDLLDQVNFRINMAGEDLAVAIAQDHASDDVLMVAFMNREALEKTLETGKMHYFSTSRKKLWLKGEESGHVQEVLEALIDCDGDSLLFKVKQTGAACHKGYGSCFFRKLRDGKWEIFASRVFKPEDVYSG